MKLIIHTEFVQWIETLIKWKCWIVGPFVAFYDLAPKPVGKKKSCFEATNQNGFIQC